MILIILILGILLGVIQYIGAEKNERKISYGELLIEMIRGKQYKKSYMPNDYPDYAKELEDKDTKEYIDFISSGVLKFIK